MRKLTGGVVMGLLLGCALAPGALAVPVLDQEYTGAGQPRLGPRCNFRPWLR